MRPAAHLFIRTALWILIGGTASAVVPPLERSVSASRQFIVYGVTPSLRGAVADAAERTKTNVLGILQQRDEWRIPIILNLEFPQANVPDTPATSLRFSQTGAGLKIQLGLTIDSDFDPVGLSRQLLRVIVLELAYRNKPDLPAGSFYVETPDWLVEGLLAADSAQDRARMIAAVAPLVSDDNILPLEKFLGQKLSHLDAAGEMLYRAYAFAFLQLLVQDSGGALRLRNYIANLSAASADPIADLKVFFPVLATGPAVDPIWKASVASLKLRSYELLTATETERQLGELVGSGTTGSIAAPTNFQPLIKRKLSKDEVVQLRQLRAKLIVLAAKGNPINRRVVVEYQLIVERILAHKLKGLEIRVARLGKAREQVRSRANDIDDYMNWFEATKSGTSSGAFNGYLRAAARANELQSRRRDPLSVYLDVLEEQF